MPNGDVCKIAGDAIAQTFMPDKIRQLPEDEALEQIVETVQHAGAGEAPFALVLGSGFSHGLVPTALELVADTLPLWMKSLQDGVRFESLVELSATQRQEIARAFWRQFVDRNKARDLVLSLDHSTGLPEINADAYKAAFDPGYSGGVGKPAQARNFQRALMRLDQPRLNAAHFLLASLLGVQPGRSRNSKLFKARAAFSRLILTTNFDPFLQIALQAVNRLYIMSDTPTLGVSDDILDDHTDAIHLVYVHGSIHRRGQATTENEIRTLKEKNAHALVPVLKRRGVIVLGYSGWDDAIVDALAACDSFDHLLYWCGREADPLAKGAFGPRVQEILRKQSAFYVKIGGAGNFMAQLCARLVEGLPRLLGNPIGQLKEMLETIDLAELRQLPATVMSGPVAPQILGGRSNPDAIVKAQQLAIERLAQLEEAFLGPVALPLVPQEEAPKPDRRRKTGNAAGSRAQIRRLLSSAQAAEALGNYTESLNLSTRALALNGLQPAERAELLNIRGSAQYFLGNKDDAFPNWTAVIDLAGATVAAVARALYNRGVAWNEKGELEKGMADYRRLIEELPGAPAWDVGSALYNRAVAWAQKGDLDRALADYGRVIELPGALVEDVATALNNRAIIWGQKGETTKQLADHTRVVEQLPEAPVRQVAIALINRAAAWGNVEKQLADYTQAIELPDAPDDQVAVALGSRGWTNYERKAYAAFLADTEAALGKNTSLGFAAFNLGLALLVSGRDADALAAYRKAAEQFPADIEALGLADLRDAQKTWLSKERAEPVIRLLESLKKEPVPK